MNEAIYTCKECGGTVAESKVSLHQRNTHGNKPITVISYA